MKDPAPTEASIAELVDQVRRLRVRIRELEQQRMEEIEWRLRQKELLEHEIEFLRSISLEYKVVDFLRRQIERSTGVSSCSRQIQAEDCKVSLVAIPGIETSALIGIVQALTKQTHQNWEIITVADEETIRTVKQLDLSSKLQAARADPSLPAGARLRLAISMASGEICGFLSPFYSLYPGALANVSDFFAEYPTQIVGHAPLITETNGVWRLRSTTPYLTFFQACRGKLPDLEQVFFRKARCPWFGLFGSEFAGDWKAAGILKLLRMLDSRLIPYAVAIRSDGETSARSKSTQRICPGSLRDLIDSPRLKPFWWAEWLHQLLRHELSSMRARCFPILRERFAYATNFSPTKSLKNRTIEFSELSIPICPITEEFPDTFWFSLALPESEDFYAARVLYHSRSKLAFIWRGGNGAEVLEQDRAPGRVSIESQSTDRDRAGAVTTDVDRDGRGRSSEPLPDDNRPGIVGDAYQQAVRFVLPARSAQRVLEIVDLSRSHLTENKGDSLWEQIDRRNLQKESWIRSANLEKFDQSDLSQVGPENPDSLFNVVHLKDVLPVCSQPRLLLRVLANLLTWDGFFLVSLPSLDSEQLQAAGPAWCHWRPAENVFIYGRESLRRLLSYCGFDEVKAVTLSHSFWNQQTAANVAAGSVSSTDAALGPAKVHALQKEGLSSDKLSGDFLVALFQRRY